MRHIWQQAKPIANGSSRFVNVTSGCYIVTLLHCYIVTFVFSHFVFYILE